MSPAPPGNPGARDESCRAEISCRLQQSGAACLTRAVGIPDFSWHSLCPCLLPSPQCWDEGTDIPVGFVFALHHLLAKLLPSRGAFSSQGWFQRCWAAPAPWDIPPGGFPRAGNDLLRGRGWRQSETIAWGSLCTLRAPKICTKGLGLLYPCGCIPEWEMEGKRGGKPSLFPGWCSCSESKPRRTQAE